MFSDPNLLGKLAANPRTSKHLADPSFVQKVRPFQSLYSVDGALNGSAHSFEACRTILGSLRLLCRETRA